MTSRSISIPPYTDYISHDKGISNGKPIISETRMKVAQIALEYERLGWTPDQIVDAHPQLTLAQVHAALSYYYGNLPRFHEELKENQEFLDNLRRQYLSKVSPANVS